MDGVNLALVKIDGKPPSLRADLIGSRNTPYSNETQRALLQGRASSVADVSKLNFLIAREFSSCVKAFLNDSGTDPSSIDAVGSHGQTLFHQTSAQGSGSTLQVGSPSIIAELTGIITIGNFHYRDIAAGGHGAPLVAYADYLLHAVPGSVVALNNLGSISNVTVIGRGADDALAFDTGPANLVIDYVVRRLTNGKESCDLDGAFSRYGVVIEPMLKALLQNPYYMQPPPKAAGYQEFLGHQLDTAIDQAHGRRVRTS